MTQTATAPTTDLVRSIQATHVPNVSRCFQCRKCTNGCPVTPEMDFMPNQVIRMVQLGMKDALLASKTIWVCASCETCTTRCPNDIDIAKVMDALRQMGLKEGVPAAEPKVPQFHAAFLNSIKMFGRVFELGMTGEYKMRSKDFMSDIGLGMGMFKRGKLNLLPHVIKGRKEVKAMFGRAQGGK
jgi:heterodisulfide reductase subunit C2